MSTDSSIYKQFPIQVLYSIRIERDEQRSENINFLFVACQINTWRRRYVEQEKPLDSSAILIYHKYSESKGNEMNGMGHQIQIYRLQIISVEVNIQPQDCVFPNFQWHTHPFDGHCILYCIPMQLKSSFYLVSPRHDYTFSVHFEPFVLICIWAITTAFQFTSLNLLRT